MLQGMFNVQRVIDAQVMTGLVLSTPKCEIVANEFDLVDKYPEFRDVKRKNKEDWRFLVIQCCKAGLPTKVILWKRKQEKIADLEHVIKWMGLLQAHDALCLLRIPLKCPSYCTC